MPPGFLYGSFHFVEWAETHPCIVPLEKHFTVSLDQLFGESVVGVPFETGSKIAVFHGTVKFALSLIIQGVGFQGLFRLVREIKCRGIGSEIDALDEETAVFNSNGIGKSADFEDPGSSLGSVDTPGEQPNDPGVLEIESLVGPTSSFIEAYFLEVGSTSEKVLDNVR
jgi:hypothetical protein